MILGNPRGESMGATQAGIAGVVEGLPLKPAVDELHGRVGGGPGPGGGDEGAWIMGARCPQAAGSSPMPQQVVDHVPPGPKAGNVGRGRSCLAVAPQLRGDPGERRESVGQVAESAAGEIFDDLVPAEASRRMGIMIESVFRSVDIVVTFKVGDVFHVVGDVNLSRRFEPAASQDGVAVRSVMVELELNGPRRKT